MPIYHVRFTCAPDYDARRLPFRPAHLKQLASLREQGRVVAGGPEPDGTAAHIFYRVADRARLDALLEENEFNRAGLFVAHHPRAFVEFLEPLDPPPVDAGLQVSIVEGTSTDRAVARSGFIGLRERGRLAFGGFFEDGAALAMVRSPDQSEAIGWLTSAGGFKATDLRARSWSQTL
ncbi:MAG TPA: hypothetical protein VMS64_40990 [Candidatus Methylomirabilis sp.]|nr:hypothetical protein [Candidatus Methylomirabilis sp.]